MFEEKTIENPKYIAGVDGENTMISCTINGVAVSVSLDPNNTDYAAILKWAEEDGNTIEDAD